MTRGREGAGLLAMVLASLAVHAAAYAVLPEATVAAPPRAPSTVTMTIVAPSRPPAPPVVAPVDEPEAIATPAPVAGAATAKPEARRPRARAGRAAPARQPTATPAAPAAETTADFTGVTLTNHGATWQSPTGNGRSGDGPIGAPAARLTGRRRDGAVGGETDGPGSRGERVVAAADLSRAPRPPALDDALAANYPETARAQGRRGRAVVRARIRADGRVGAIKVVSERGDGFGAACVRTLRGSRWQPPLDRDGRPVATDVAYTCEFVVAP